MTTEYSVVNTSKSYWLLKFLIKAILCKIIQTENQVK